MGSGVARLTYVLCCLLSSSTILAASLRLAGSHLSGSRKSGSNMSSSRRWEDPETPDKIHAFKEVLDALGTRPLAIGPLDGRNNSRMYVEGKKNIWKAHLRRQLSIDNQSALPEESLELEQYFDMLLNMTASSEEKP